MRLQSSHTNCGSGRGRPLGSPEIDWYAAESALRARDAQEEFSPFGLRMKPEEGPYREP
jgi:hypothetical protein